MPPFRVLSLGAGLDSTTLLLLSEHGEVPRLDAAIFADTMAEPQGVYDTLDWLSAHVSIPIIRVSAGSLDHEMRERLAGRGSNARQCYPPFYMKKANGLDGAPLHRRCTDTYKIRPIYRAIRQLLGKGPRASMRDVQVEQWIGFTLDDMGRTFCSETRWITNVYPLILPKQMHKRDCVAWLEGKGYPIPPKSSCVFCPFHRNAYWRDMRDRRPEEWQRAVQLEADLQRGQLPGVQGTPYLHRSLIPLPLAPIDDPETGQEELFCFACNT